MMPVYRRTRDTEPQLSGRRLRAHRGGELDRRRAKGKNDYFIKRMKNQECASGTARHKHTAHKRGGLVCASNTVLRSCDMSSRLQSSDPIRSTHLHRWRDFENLSSPMRYERSELCGTAAKHSIVAQVHLRCMSAEFYPRRCERLNGKLRKEGGGVA